MTVETKIYSDELQIYPKEVIQQALEKSIKKWNRNLKYAMNREYSKITLGAESCALCNLFFMTKEGFYIYSMQNWGNDCIGCPVAKKSGHNKCLKTPYEDFNDIFFDRNYGEYKTNKTLFQNHLVEAIEKEISFLESLREKDGDENE